MDDAMVEVVVSRIGVEPSTQSHVIVLQEKGGARLLPIWIGPAETESIVMHIQNQKRPRPLTHDLCKSLIAALGATLRRVEITHVEKNTYFAHLRLERGGTALEVDARPSDSIAIALRMDAPIFATESLLMTVEEEAPAEGETPSFAAPEPPSFVVEDDLSAERLKQYLQQLRPEDFGKFNP